MSCNNSFSANITKNKKERVAYYKGGMPAHKLRKEKDKEMRKREYLKSPQIRKVSFAKTNKTKVCCYLLNE